jgi:DNA primase
VPGKYYSYYQQVAERMAPHLTGRRVSIESRYPGSPRIVFRRHPSGGDTTQWIFIDEPPQLVDWVRQFAEGFHGHIRAEDGSAWFVLDIDARDLPLEMAQLAARYAADVLETRGLAPLVKFSGSNGFHLMWNVPDSTDLSDAALWEIEQRVVAAVACEVERLLEADDTATPIRVAVGPEKPMITTSSADREQRDGLLFDQLILRDNAPFRVPFSVHPKSGLVAVPILAKDLTAFDPAVATPERVAQEWPALPVPNYSLQQVRDAVTAWETDGC